MATLLNGMDYQLHHGENSAFLDDLSENTLDSCVTDPPAWVSFMSKKWDSPDELKKFRGVMEQVLFVLKPGAHALVWALPRTAHKTTSALEDAGFEIRDVITHLTGQGFPKGQDISKGIDKAMGVERKVVGEKDSGNSRTGEGWVGGHTTVPITEPATEEATEWEGWNTALKPASENWIHCYKPFAVSREMDTLLIDNWLLVECLLWSALPVQFVKKYLMSSKAEPRKPSSAQENVATLGSVVHQLVSTGKSTLTGMCDSREEASTLWNIGMLWSSILDGTSKLGNTSTTRTITEVTTLLKTLRLSIGASIPDSTIQRLKTRLREFPSVAEVVEKNLSDLKATHGTAVKSYDAPTAPGNVTRHVESLLVLLAESLSLITGMRSESSARLLVPTDITSEHWILCRKPLSEKSVAKNVLKWGVGGLNINSCRTGLPEKITSHSYSYSRNTFDFYVAADLPKGPYDTTERVGRWPANVVMTGELDDLPVWARFFYVPKVSSKERNIRLNGCEIIDIIIKSRQKGSSWEELDQKVKLRVDTETSPPKVIDGCATEKENREWNMFLFGNEQTGPSLKVCKSTISTEINLTTGSKTLNWLMRSLTSESTAGAKSVKGHGGNLVGSVEILSPSMVSITFEKPVSLPGAVRAASPMQLIISASGSIENRHETVKPLELMRHLVRLITPPGGTVLDPYCGSGSTGVAAMQEGFKFVGMEREEEYYNIALNRLNAAVNGGAA